MVMLHIKLNEITNFSNMVAHIFPLTLGAKGQNSTFPKLFYVAYQIKGNQECRNIVANILPADRLHPQALGLGSKGHTQFFSEHGHAVY